MPDLDPRGDPVCEKNTHWLDGRSNWTDATTVAIVAEQADRVGRTPSSGRLELDADRRGTMTNSPDRHARAVLPIPDRPAPGLTTYDAKDPETSFPPIEPLLPPGGAPNVLDRLARRRGFRSVQRLRWSVPDAHGGAARSRWTQVQPVPHHRVVRADARGDAVRAQPPLGRDGKHHRDRDVRAGEQLAATEHEGAAGTDVEAQRVLDGAVRQVPRGAGVAVVADGPLRRVAVGGRRIRDLLRLHRR